MKKTILLIVALLLSCVVVFASDGNFSFDCGVGNDSFTRGLSRNEDDFKSYALYLDLFFKDFDILFDLDAYTFKNENYRYDLLTVEVTKSFVFKDFYYLKAYLGLQAKGNFCGEFFQNNLHRWSKITEVFLPYESDEYRIFLRAAAEGYLDYTISPYLYAKTGFDWAVEGGARLEAGETTAIYLTYGYDSFGENELNLRMDSDYGFLITTYKTNLLNHFGFGTILINPFKKMQGNGTTVTGTDYMTHHGKYSMYEVRFPVLDELTAFVNVLYQTGEVDHNPLIREEDNWYSAGAGYKICSFIELRLYGGAHYFETREDSEIESSLDPVFGLGSRIKIIEAFHVTLSAEAGLLWEDEFEAFGGWSLTF